MHKETSLGSIRVIEDSLDDELVNASSKPLNAPLLPTGEDIEDIAKTFIGVAFGAIVTTLATAISRRYALSIYFSLAFALWIWLAYRRRVKSA